MTSLHQTPRTTVKAYRIRNWAKLYENNRTRELKRIEWVPIPNKHDGDGYAELLEHPEGMAHFGAWVLLLQVASKCDPRGTLVREGGTMPLDARSIARRCRGNVAIIESAIPRLVQIGWLETFEMPFAVGRDNPAPACGDPAPSCDTVPIESKGSEGKGREDAPHPPATTAPAARLDADAIVDDPEARWPYERREPWARALEPIVGNKLGAKTWPRWKRLADRYTAVAVAAAAEALPPDQRWDDRVETHLIENAPPPPDPVDVELDRVRALVGVHGWQACLAVVGLGNVRSAEVLLHALDGNRPACRRLIAHYDGGAAAAGAGAA